MISAISTTACVCFLIYILRKVETHSAEFSRLQDRVRYLSAEVGTLNTFIKRAPSLKPDVAQFEAQSYIGKNNSFDSGVGVDFTYATTDKIKFYDWRDRLHGEREFIDDSPPESDYEKRLTADIRSVLVRLNQIAPEAVSLDHITWLNQQNSLMGIGSYLRWLTPQLEWDTAMGLYKIPDEAKAEIAKLAAFFKRDPSAPQNA